MPKNYVYQRAEDLGIPIVDSTSPVVMAVTEHDVVNAKKANSKHCALSRAALRLPNVVAAYFFRSAAFLEYRDRMVRFNLPASVQKEIVSFDRAQIFAPGVYQLSAIEPSRSPAKTKKYRTKRKKVERARVRSLAAQAAAQRAELTKKIETIAARTQQPDTPEFREFNNRIAGIMSVAAPTPIAPEGKRMHHRTQYVRTLAEPK